MAAVSTAASFKFTVHRRPALLVAPATPTPRGLKLLSDIDDQELNRCHLASIELYRRQMGGRDRDPARVIRDALARALVHYYPLAGRLREVEGGKLAVDCTGEGVLFIEADADVRLDDFPQPLLPPFPCLQELLFDVPGSSAIVDAPLLLVQVTRLACGGFILAVRFNHAVADAAGLVQFFAAVAELARGALAPTVRPVWRRDLLMARHDLPQPSFADSDDKATAMGTDDDDDISLGAGDQLMAHRCFFFDPSDIAVLRGHLEPPRLRSSATTFELLAGCLWKCRTVALAPADADLQMRILYAVNARGIKNPGPGPAGSFSIPKGYYGNAAVGAVAVSAAGEICARPVSYAVNLVKKAKEEVNMEHIRSLADLAPAHRGRLPISFAHTYFVSDVSKIGLADVDFGWGKPDYAGPADLGRRLAPGVASFFVPARNAKGELGIAVLVCLPANAMDRFVEEIGKLLQRPLGDGVPRQNNPMSAL